MRGAALVTVVLLAVGTAPASANVRAIWKMDETGGSAMHDSSGGRHTGIVHNVAMGLQGWMNRAYGFNGESSYAVVPTAPNLNPGSYGIVFSMHVLVPQRPSLGTDYDLFRKGTSTTPGGMYKSELRSDGRASCRFRGSRHDLRIHAGPVITNGKWHTVSCWKLSTKIHLVVDGEVFTVPGVVGRIANSSSIVLGAKPGGDWYAGRIDHVKITFLN